MENIARYIAMFSNDIYNILCKSFLKCMQTPITFGPGGCERHRCSGSQSIVPFLLITPAPKFINPPPSSANADSSHHVPPLFAPVTIDIIKAWDDDTNKCWYVHPQKEKRWRWSNGYVTVRVKVRGGDKPRARGIKCVASYGGDGRWNKERKGVRKGNDALWSVVDGNRVYIVCSVCLQKRSLPSTKACSERACICFFFCCWEMQTAGGVPVDTFWKQIGPKELLHMLFFCE